MSKELRRPLAKEQNITWPIPLPAPQTQAEYDFWKQVGSAMTGGEDR